MPTLLLRFPAGRYHATPWGSHVNEGAVEWPPSPWRILRALIATGYSKLDLPDPVPTDHPMQRLVKALSDILPRYHLPTGVESHSRHYMPLGVLDKGREETTLVIDAYAFIKGGSIAVTWDVELDAECENLLRLLAQNMSYLGRAESWVEGELVSSSFPYEGDEVRPYKEGEGVPRGKEQVSLLAPVEFSEYGAWYKSAVETALAEFPISEDQRPTTKLLKDREKASDPYPKTLFDCLTRNTAWLQAKGWSQPPGSARVLYLRSTSGLNTSRVSVVPRLQSKPFIEAAVLALTSDTVQGNLLPPLWRVLPQAERLHAALVGNAGRGAKIDCPVLTGRDLRGALLKGHKHIHIIPIVEDDLTRGASSLKIGHFLLWAPMGFDGIAQKAISDLRRTWSKGIDGDISITLAGTGSLKELESLIQPRFNSTARVWVSYTPFVPPRHIKVHRHTLEQQAHAELASRGFPSAKVDVLDKDAYIRSGLHRFVRARKDAGKAPPIDCGFGIQLTFPEPVSGPISLGYASHFGLGLFAPAPDA